MSEMKANVLGVIKTIETLGRFHLRPSPLHIADVDYEFVFDAVLEGPEDEHNLVFVCSPSEDQITALERRLRALSVALRRSGSIRPFSLVLLLDQPNETVAAKFQALCRVFIMLPQEQPEVALAPLLPLPMPDESQTLITALDALKKELATSNQFISDLIRAASDDSPVVEKYVLNAIRTASTVDLSKMVAQ